MNTETPKSAPKFTTLLLLLTGLPASGKSFLSHRLKQLFEIFIEVRIYNSDSIFDELCSQNEHKTLKADESAFLLKRAQSKLLNKLQGDILKHSNHSNQILIIDNTNHYRSMRRTYWKIARDSQIIYRVIWCKSSLEICLNRNIRRLNALNEKTVSHSYVDDEQIQKIAEIFEKPLENENVVILDMDNQLDDEDLILMIEKSFIDKYIPISNAEIDLNERRNKSRHQIAESELHQVDCTLRKEISNTVKNCSSTIDRSIIIRKLNSIKSQVLQDVRKSLNGDEKAEHLDDRKVHINGKLRFSDYWVQKFKRLVTETIEATERRQTL